MSVIAKYMRISSEDAIKNKYNESESITNQRGLLDEYILQNSEFDGWDILEFSDDGWSGTNFERPAVKELLEKVKHGHIQCIIVKDLSRFGRDYLTVGDYISRVFPFMGVRFIALGDSYDSIRPSDIDSLSMSFSTLIYDLYSCDLSNKVRSAKDRQAENGDFMSPFAPFGYEKALDNRNLLVIDKAAAQIVRYIFEMIITGKSTTEVARALNNEDFPTPMLYKRKNGCSRTKWPSISEDNFWTDKMVSKIIRDERYIGKNIYGKRRRTTVGSWHTDKVCRDKWIVLDCMHEGIVSREEFGKAQEQLREYREMQSTKQSGNLTRKVYCGVCGHCMKRNHSKNVLFFCPTPAVNVRFQCSSERIRESDINEAVLTAIRTYARCAVHLDHLLTAQSEQWKIDAKQIQRQIAGLQVKRERTEKRQQVLYESFVEGSIIREDYLSRKQTLTEQAQQHIEELRKLELMLDRRSSATESQFISRYKNYEALDTLTDEIVDELLERVTVYPDRVLDIMLNFSDELDVLIHELDDKPSKTA